MAQVRGMYQFIKNKANIASLQSTLSLQPSFSCLIYRVIILDWQTLSKVAHFLDIVILPEENRGPSQCK